MQNIDEQLELIDMDDKAPIDQLENEDDIEVSAETVNDSVLFSTDWTVETIFNQIEKGNINLDPKFQRREAWDDARKSRLIESILCNFPIPNIVIAENKGVRGKYIVIDGKQRLFSISSYLNDSFKLRGLKIRTDLNDINFGSLEDGDKTAIENYTIKTVVIRNWPNEDHLYAIYFRLNSGSLPLSSQELRKALRGGNLLDRIDEYTKSSLSFQEIFGNTPDRRMRDIELILRYIAFQKEYHQYKGNLKKFLDDTVEYYQKFWEREQATLSFYLSNLDEGLDLSRKIFGDNVFKKWNADGYERRTNRAVFDIITWYFSDSEVRNLALDKETAIEEAFKQVCSNPDFRKSIEQTTKTPLATNTRHILWGEALSKALNANLDRQNMRISR